MSAAPGAKRLTSSSAPALAESGAGLIDASLNGSAEHPLVSELRGLLERPQDASIKDLATILNAITAELGFASSAISELQTADMIEPTQRALKPHDQFDQQQITALAQVLTEVEPR